MTTDEVIAIVRDRGLKVSLNSNGVPCVGPLSSGQVTPTLLRVLKLHRADILERLLPKPRRQFLWRTGAQATEPEGGQDNYPAGAWWWRNEGDRGWRPIPGRNPDSLPLPEGEVLA